MNNGYVICPKQWILDKTIRNELGLLLIISSLCNNKGYCYANNKYLCTLFEVPEQTISRKLKILEQKKYIEIKYEKHGCKVVSRHIRLTKMLTHGEQKCEPTVNKNVKDNNINVYNNIKYINDIDIYYRVPLDDTSQLCERIVNAFNKMGIEEASFVKNKRQFHFKNTKVVQKLVSDILKRGYTEKDIFDVIFLKYDQWIEENSKNSIDMSTYYRPSTILGKKFDEYYEEAKMKGIS